MLNETIPVESNLDEVFDVVSAYANRGLILILVSYHAIQHVSWRVLPYTACRCLKVR